MNTIKSKVLEYKAQNPSASYKEIADACGTTVAYIYTLIPKRKKIVKKIASAAVEKKEPSDKKLDAALEEIEIKEMIIEAQLKRIQELHAVISYLEDKVDELNELKYC